jgi:hypothetical protein
VADQAQAYVEQAEKDADADQRLALAAMSIVRNRLITPRFTSIATPLLNIINRMLRALIACSRRSNLEPPTLLDLVARSLYAQRANNAHCRADQWAQLPVELRELVEVKILVHLARRTLLIFSCAAALT